MLLLQQEGGLDVYRTCEPPYPVLVLIEPKFEEPSPRLSSDAEVDPHRDANVDCGWD